VAQVPVLPKQTDVAALAQTLDLIGAKQRQLLKKTAQFDQINQELAALQSEFEQWVDANPVCPTCGSETDAQHVLQQHAHVKHHDSGESRG